MENIPFDFVKRQKEFIDKTINFVYNHLDEWRNSKDWKNNESERKLNSDLVKSLDKHARAIEFLAIFSAEEPQEEQRSIDIVACHYDNYRDHITVFECKRLTTDTGKDRADEYVTGHKKTGGGIQRFKLEAHGKEHETVGMIGYVQTGTCTEWQKIINDCIDGLCDKPDEDDLCWTKNEHLNTIEYDEKNGKYYGKSLHSRKTRPNITIHHLWVNMQGNSA